MIEISCSESWFVNFFPNQQETFIVIGKKKAF